MSPALLTHIINAAREILAFTQPADGLLSQFFRQHPKLGRQERAEIAETIFTLLRHLEKIEMWLQDAPARQLRLAVLGALQLRQGHRLAELTPHLTESEHTALARLAGLSGAFADTLNTAAELPQWLIDKLRTQFNDDEIRTLGQALNRSAPLDVRVNTLKARQDKVLQQLQDEGFQATATPYAPYGIRFADKPALQRHPLFLDGAIEIQDEGSQLLALLTGAKRNEMIVDFCAGAGGKTLAIGAMMQNSGRLYACDVSAKRLANLKPRLAKSGLGNVTTLAIDHENDARLKRLWGKCDAVLVDAPCSGLGTLRRSPDLKYRQSPKEVEKMTSLQASILRAAAPLVAVGGRLIYATCSILDEENTHQINHFLAEHPEFTLADAGEILHPYTKTPINGKMLQLTPSQHHTDGFFSAVLHKKDIT